MSAYRNPNRSMFWRIIRRLLSANRGRLFVILLALGAGAAVTAALLNLQIDAKRRISTEFRSLGANVIVSPRDPSNSPEAPRFLDDSLLAKIPESNEGAAVAKAQFLYGVIDVAKATEKTGPHVSTAKAILVGLSYSGTRPEHVIPPALVESGEKSHYCCKAGQRLAANLQLAAGDTITLASGSRSDSCQVDVLPASGGPDDGQVFLDLRSAQALLQQPGHTSVIQLSVAGTPRQIQNYIASLQQRFPEADVRPIRQFTEGEAKIYNRISGILTATVGLVLILTGLCVMAAMTNIAMERRNDVGLMKAIGGATRRVLRLFLAEAALLGLAGGLLGAAMGMLLSVWLGKTVFGVAAQPRLIVYPVAVALTIIVAIGGAYPLRRLANIRPASVFRGEA